MGIARCVFLIFILSLFFIHAKTNLCGAVIDGIAIHGQCRGALKHGKFVGYYPSGILAWEIHYKNDKLHGKFQHFYANGSPHFIGSYKNGVLNGKFVQYAKDNGVLTANFKHGVLHNWINITLQGKKTQALQYYYGKLITQKYFD